MKHGLSFGTAKEMPERFIPVCEPLLGGNELTYVTDAVQTGWISSAGSYIERFEQAFARYCGVSFGVAVTNGTVALHVALRALGVGVGDEVIVPSFTMIASAFAVCYTGAMPVFVDVDRDTWNMDSTQLESKISARTRAVMPVHVFGTLCDMDIIDSVARRHGLFVVEDAAEAHGAEQRGRKAGAFSAIAAFSFFANKNITTGEGGMVVTDDPELRDKSRYYRNLCFPLTGSRDYRHDHIGYNYRMSNLHAAIGLAQVEKADEYRTLRIRNHALYREHLRGVPGITFQKVPPDTVSVSWMNAILVDSKRFGRTRGQVIAYLKARGVDSRLLFTGMHRQKALSDYGCDCSGSYPVTDLLSEQGLYLPSGSGLSEDDIRYVCSCIRQSRETS